MNQYPLWKYLVIVIALVISVIYALPNLFGDEPALQIIGSGRTKISETDVTRIKQVLDTAAVTYKGTPAIVGNSIQVRFESEDAQFKAQELVKTALGENYTVAFNLVPATPDWLRALGAKPMYLGLDLRGGLHLLIEVDMPTAARQDYERLRDEFSDALRAEQKKNKEKDIKPRSITSDANGVDLSFMTADQRDAAKSVLLRQADAVTKYQFSETTQGSTQLLRATLSAAAIQDFQTKTVTQVITVLKKRLDEKYQGLLEPVIVRQGTDRIVTELPGVQNPAEILELLSATASLEFHMEEEQQSPADAQAGHVIGARLYKRRDSGESYLLKKNIIVTGKEITFATPGTDDKGLPAVVVHLNGAGALKMGETTKKNVGKKMAVVFIEQKPTVTKKDGKEETTYHATEEVINIATIQGVFSNRFQITGMEPDESNKLALLLRAGALAAPIKIAEQRTVGPAVGQVNIDKGFKSSVFAFLLVAGFMLLYYKAFGIAANLALVFNVVMIVAVLSLFQATLTLPGIAGIALTIGMAVDANVLINERIREELSLGNSPQSSISAGYERAFTTIADSNITALIAALALFLFGTGPVKGFATTLSIGIATSMFTAIMGTRAIVNLVVGGRKLKKLWI